LPADGVGDDPDGAASPASTRAAAGTVSGAWRTRRAIGGEPPVDAQSSARRDAKNSTARAAHRRRCTCVPASSAWGRWAERGTKWLASSSLSWHRAARASVAAAAAKAARRRSRASEARAAPGAGALGVKGDRAARLDGDIARDLHADGKALTRTQSRAGTDDEVAGDAERRVQFGHRAGRAGAIGVEH